MNRENKNDLEDQKLDSFRPPISGAGGVALSQTRPADPPFRSQTGGSEIQYEHYGSGRRRRRLPWKTVAAAIALTALGLILICTSIDFVLTGHKGSMPFFILGLIVIIPGAYASVQIVGVVRRWPGYNLDYLPSYE
mmetsp:Transcript_33923/g.44750  ORF Transcript_33923/g.44750 Transcript_33923/m.44750 type:complete len:136 (+) Transcript_33923:218-625(+)